MKVFNNPVITCTSPGERQPVTAISDAVVFLSFGKALAVN
jgi:hypothetical protein